MLQNRLKVVSDSAVSKSVACYLRHCVKMIELIEFCLFCYLDIKARFFVLDTRTVLPNVYAVAHNCAIAAVEVCHGIM